MARVGLAVVGAALLLIGSVALSCGRGGEPGGGTGDGQGGGQTRTSQVDGITAIRLLPGAGGVQVRHTPGGGGRVEQRVRRWDGAGWQGDKLYHRVESGTLVLDTDCGEKCSVDFAVTLPSQVPIAGELGAGALDVAGMESVQAKTGAGDVDLADIAGRVAVETGSGHVEGRDLSGKEISAMTASGGATLRLAAPESVQVESDSGDIELVVPQNTYRVEAETGAGDAEIDVPQDPNSPRLLKLTTGAGGIKVQAG
jgi:hypothetical protein